MLGALPASPLRSTSQHDRQRASEACPAAASPLSFCLLQGRVAVLLGVARHALVFEQLQLAAQPGARVPRQDDVIHKPVLGGLRACQRV